MKRIGIDIGTTTICGAVVDVENKSFIESVTRPNGTFIETENPWEKIQNPKEIIKTAKAIVDELIDRHPDTVSIGVSGQMHGIVYVDCEGQPVSNLYIWQDGRGELKYDNDKSYASYIKDVTGYKVATGFGLVTHFYNMKNSLVPESARKLCTIHDLFAMTLCGRNTPVMHTSDAASLGLFDLEKLGFDKAAIGALGIDTDVLPEVERDFKFIGEYRSIPVCTAIGDNQASFLGSLSHEDDSLLVNVGTGSQISLMCDGYRKTEGAVELRPLFGNKYLLVGSSLSGGRAYAMLESFFREVANMTGAGVDSMYKYMDSLAKECDEECTLCVSTLFDGTREDPSKRGSITNIGISNFTPFQMMLGFCRGISHELFEMYSQMNVPMKNKIIGSGNGIRKNDLLRKAVLSDFGLMPEIPHYKEEASCGAAISSSMAM